MELRTDLAVEQIEANGTQIDGVESRELSFDGIRINRVRITNQNGANVLGKPQGNYTTIEFDDLNGDGDAFASLVDKTAFELSEICKLKEGDTVLIAGLGNEMITPDSLGPRTAKKTLATRHMKESMPEFSYGNVVFRDVAVISPGVMWQTGIETADIVKGVTDRIKPNVIIVIDALMSRKMKRLAKTIQIADSGLIPGGGVGNARAAITKENLGIPVISLGVPTVVDAATLSCDVIDEVLASAQKIASEDIKTLFKGFSTEEKYELIKESLTPYDLNLIVTPKDIDFFIGEISKALGYTINKSMHQNITIEDMDSLLA